MKIFPTASVKELDAYTIANEPIASIDLMERASQALTAAILRNCPDAPFAIFAGAGNNGGDGLAVARMLLSAGRDVEVWSVAPSGRLSADCSCNLARLCQAGCAVNSVGESFSAPSLPDNCVIIDALFGSGLNKPVTGVYADIIHFINGAGHRVVAIDIPSGLMGEDNSSNIPGNIVKANLTLTLQFPKLSFFFAENEPFVGRFEVLDIGLSREGIERLHTEYSLIEKRDIINMLQPRGKFSHKGNFGRALLVAGSYGMAGASLLAAKAAMRSGVGLLTVNLPQANNLIMQTSLPEAMTLPDNCATHISAAVPTDVYTAVAAGPGLGQHPATANALFELIEHCASPMIVDADALNILATNIEWLKRLPEGSVITPHPGEFARLAGKSTSGYEALQKARAMARENNICVVLKGACTAVVSPSGECSFNSTGNPGMATGGSGDALTGIILALVARGYSSYDAARIAVYVHGAAGDTAAEFLSETAMIAGDIVEYLPTVWNSLETLKRNDYESL